jgi:hypothetical protein
LKLTSITPTVDFATHPPPPPSLPSLPSPPNSLASADFKTHRAPPLVRGMWAGSTRRRDQVAGSRGDPWSGRPTQCVARHDESYASSFVFSYLPPPPLTAPDVEPITYGPTQKPARGWTTTMPGNSRARNREDEA